MRGPLSSPRRRRRLAWWGGGGALLAGVVAALVIWPNTGDNPKITYDTGPVHFTPSPTQVRPAREDVLAAKTVAARFILTAVAREHLEESWELASPAMRQGMSRKEWETGDIPVATFPVEQLYEARENLAFSFKDDIAFDVLLMAKPNAPVHDAVFTAELKAFGKGSARRWLVDSWQPKGVAEPDAAPVPGGGGRAPDPNQLSAVWLLVPIGIFSLVVLVPIGFGVRGWWRANRAERAYMSSSRPS